LPCGAVAGRAPAAVDALLSRAPQPPTAAAAALGSRRSSRRSSRAWRTARRRSSAGSTRSGRVTGRAQRGSSLRRGRLTGARGAWSPPPARVFREGLRWAPEPRRRGVTHKGEARFAAGLSGPAELWLFTRTVVLAGASPS
jgi:hypothetical protein